MAGYNTNHAESSWLLEGGQLANLSAAAVSYCAAPFQGVLQTAWGTMSAAITNADTIVTIKKKSGTLTAVTLGTITFTVTGSAPGTTFQAAMTGSEADRTFTAGDTLQFDNAGSSTTTSIATFVAVFKGM